MKTKAVRLYGVNDLRLEEFMLPDIREDEMLAQVMTDSLCMSSYKAAIQGEKHKRIPENISKKPIIIGHELCGKIIKAGSKWAHRFSEGENFTIQPAFNYKESMDAPGYSYEFAGGDATYIILPNEAMEMNCVLKYDSDVYFRGALAEPMSCIIRGFKSFYHLTQGDYVHRMGIQEGGRMAILGGAKRYGLGAIDYALYGPVKPSVLVVTDINEIRLDRVKRIFGNRDDHKVDFHIINASDKQAEKMMMQITEGAGFSDVMIMAPERETVEQADRILGADGCMNFFAGPTSSSFKAEIDFYRIHYASTHFLGNSGGNAQDLREAVDLIANGTINPACMVTHIGGLNSVAEATLNMPNLPGLKKLIYTNVRMPLVGIEDIAQLGKTDPFYEKLSLLIKDGIWNEKAEKYLMGNAPKI